MSHDRHLVVDQGNPYDQVAIWPAAVGVFAEVGFARWHFLDTTTNNP